MHEIHKWNYYNVITVLAVLVLVTVFDTFIDVEIVSFVTPFFPLLTSAPTTWRGEY
jgi:hypothetical protein